MPSSHLVCITINLKNKKNTLSISLFFTSISIIPFPSLLSNWCWELFWNTEKQLGHLLIEVRRKYFCWRNASVCIWSWSFHRCMEGFDGKWPNRSVSGLLIPPFHATCLAFSAPHDAATVFFLSLWLKPVWNAFTSLQLKLKLLYKGKNSTFIVQELWY